MQRSQKVELFEQIRREYQFGVVEHDLCSAEHKMCSATA
jgi:hypothetical protein